jgi:Spy/CpxP family protein refolding chaperone
MTRRAMKAALLGLTAAALAAAQSVSAADALAPAPAAAPGMSGPLIAGVCLISQEDLISRSKVGQAAMARLHSLTQAAQAALEADKARLERQSAALNAQRAKLAPAVFQAQGLALNKRAQVFQAGASLRRRSPSSPRPMRPTAAACCSRATH